MASDVFEVMILVRVDDMTTMRTQGQRSIRFEIPEGETVADMVEHALKNAPPVEEWNPS